jgi:hypothetical protein
MVDNESLFYLIRCLSFSNNMYVIHESYGTVFGFCHAPGPPPCECGNRQSKGETDGLNPVAWSCQVRGHCEVPIGFVDAVSPFILNEQTPACGRICSTTAQ